MTTKKSKAKSATGHHKIGIVRQIANVCRPYFAPIVCAMWMLFSPILLLHGWLCVVRANTDSGAQEIRQLAVTYHLPATEMQALKDLYDATGGPNWEFHAALGAVWNFTPTANPCSPHWQGITCVPLPPFNHVSKLRLNVMNLRGQLPDSFDAFTKLLGMALNENFLTGTVPRSIGRMPSLELLELSYNYFSGPLPAYLGSLVKLEYIDLSYNLFRGSIPHSFGNWTKVLAINLGDNSVSGTIPDALCKLTMMSDLHLYNNSLSGPLHQCLVNFTRMDLYDISGNHLTGTLPDFSTMTLLTDLWMYNNDFEGPISDSIYSLTRLQNLEFYSNGLTGIISNNIGQLYNMQILALFNNSLTGTLPESVCNLTLTEYFYVSTNHLQGTVPACVWNNMSHLNILDIHENHFSGSIPQTTGNISLLQYVVLYDNSLTGTIPPSFGNLTRLREFQVQENKFSGSLNDVFVPHNQRALATIQVNNNQFTGTLPREIFQLKSLVTFVAVDNCFHGALPDTICDGTALESLVLDGLSSAESCRDPLLPGLSQSYTTRRTVYGTVPACLFEVHSLTTLHLSGNGLTGTLPAAARINNALVDLTLSHNRLTGSIPDNFQTRQWFNIDLSYNRISGTLHDNFSTSMLDFAVLDSYATKFGLNVANYTLNPTLLVENNRLSGKIPGVLVNRVNISMLGTNIFSCRLDRSDVPNSDPGKPQYQCDSQSFDVPYYVWLGLLFVILCAVLVVLARQYTLTSESSEWVQTCAATARRWLDATSTAGAVSNVFEVLRKMRDIALWCAVYAVLVLLPLYCALGPSSATLTHQYAWTASAAYLSGRAATASEMALWLLLMCIVLALFVWRFPLMSTDVTSKADDANQKRLSRFIYTSICVLFTTINLIVVVGVNSAFVYVVIYQDTELLLVAQVLISLFKIAWNNACSTAILRKIIAQFVPVENEDDLRPQFVSLQVFVALLNNIVIPCFVVAVISPDCFYNVFSAAPAVSSQFSYSNCILNDNFDCFVYQDIVASTSFNPPFSYSYQCSSSMITYYAPAFVILCLVLTFVNPATQGLLLWLHRRATAEQSLWFRFLDTALPRILHPLPTESGGEEKGGGEDNKEVLRSPVLGEPRTAPLYFDGNRVLIIVLTFLGLLLTFGAVFPPLAAALLVTILATVFLHRLKVGRFLSAARERGLAEYALRLERECQGVGSVSVLHNAMWMLVCISCLFYTLFLFDTLGDAVGFADALWVLVFVPMFPVILYVLSKLYVQYIEYSQSVCSSAPAAAREGDSIELSTRSTDITSVSVVQNETINVLVENP